MRKFSYLIPFVLLVILGVASWPSEHAMIKPRKYSKQERIDGAIKDRIFTSSDVDLGHIPYNKLFNAIEEGQRRAAQKSSNRNLGGGSLTEAIWRERGPNDVGGRTRAILVDERDPDRNRIWVGGVSGGLWRSEDITQSDPQWVKIGKRLESTSISDIAQDPNDHNTLYVGSGESYTGDFLGVGVWKTTDDGQTWTLLPTTKNFSYVNEILVHASGDVYVATQSGGLLRSQNGGDTWEKVLGTSLSGASSNEFHDIYFIEANQTFYASNDNSVFKSTTGARGEWHNIGTSNPGFPQNLNRVELAVCETNPNTMYVLGAIGQSASDVYGSINGGVSWTKATSPGDFPGQDFTNGQAWYDLEIAVDPITCSRILAGGVPMMESASSGLNWNSIGSGQIHVDHHYILFDHKKPGRVFYGNDGGIWMSNNSGFTIQNKNAGYITTQFYCGAIHPEAGSPYLLGGTQDNNSLQITEPGLSPSNVVKGGDGVFCFIDQNEPDIQIVSSQFGNYDLSTDGGDDFGFGSEVQGDFINRAGYDDNANILYGQSNLGAFFRWNINTGFTDFVNVENIGMAVSAVKADPAVPNRIYFGGASGRVVRVDNANRPGTTIPASDAKLIADFPGSASVSCVYMDKQTSDDILVTMFNYGDNLENIYVTNNGGTDWVAIEGDLPDVPVRWGIFDPGNHDRVMIATDAGIWTTDDIDGDNTHWEPTDPENGMGFVRVDMLLLRDSDKVVLAATHGRGLLTTDVFSSPAPVIVAQPIAYEGQSLLIDGSHSVNAQSYEWDLGDNTTSTQQKITHTYDEPGTYTISLTINGILTLTRKISVLPYLPAPYQAGVTEYAGDFEVLPEHFAAYNVKGTGFQRGVSQKAGKDGTHSGSNAWVLGINDNLYQNDSRAELYTPQYDLSENGLYELKFWTKYAIQNPNDGLQVEYSTNGGVSWHQLGSKNDPFWYNYHNANITDGVFPVGSAYFTNAKLDWVHYVKDISFLVGEPRVSFRYVFKSDDSEPAQGLVIDDFEVTKYEGELETTVTIFNADYTGEQEITVNWTTGIEYHAQKFILERSFTGFSFEEVGQLNATGKITTVAQQYEWIDQSLRDVIYYRVKVINDNPDVNYHYEFYTDTIVLRRDVDPNVVHSVLTNPFTDRILISFSSLVTEEVSLRLFDVAGRLVRDEKYVPNNIAVEVDRLHLPQGIYVLSVQVGDAEPTSYKLFTEGR